MAQTIKLKRSATQGAAPTTSNLALGEVAINTYDGKMYIKKDVGGTESIVEIGGLSSVALGGLSDVTISSVAADQLLQYNGSEWVNVSIAEASAIMKEYQFTATSGQSTFSGSDDNSETLSYTAGAIQVFLNGIFLDSAVDYTATNGTSIVLSETVDANDYLQVVAFKKKIGDGNVSVDTFTGDDSTTAFTLSLDPGDENNTRVFIDGVYQSKSNYSVSGTTLTFSTAPPTGTAVEVEIGNRVVTLDTLSDLDLPDDVQLRLGTSQDLQIYHDGSHSYIQETGTGLLYIDGTQLIVRNSAGTEDMAKFVENAAVQLYYDNGQKFATTSTGVTVTGTAAADAYNVSSGGIGTGYQLNGGTVLNYSGGNVVVGDLGAGVILEYSGSTKLATTSTGIDVTGRTTTDNATVGSGTASTYVDLTVNGASTANYGPMIELQSAGAAFGKISNYGRIQGGTSTDMFVTTATTNNLLLGTNNIERMRIESDGDIRFGSSSNYAWVRPYESSTGNLIISSDVGATGTNGSAIKFRTRGADKMIIEHSGKVGIGTTSPDYSLHISGTGSQRLRIQKTDAGGDADLQLYSPSDSTQWILFGDSTSGNNSGVIKYVHSTNKMHFRTNDVDDRLVISSDGNVGIGTTSPRGELEIESTGVTNLYLTRNDTTINNTNSLGVIGFSGTEDGSTYIDGAQIYAKAEVSWSSGDYKTGLAFATNSGNSLTERMRLDRNGNLGIGTDSPSQLLNIEGATNPAILVTDTTNTTSLLLRSQNNTSSVGTISNHPLVLETNGTERMRIDTSGNLLVGTTAATAYNNSSDVYGFNVYANGQIASSVNGAQAAYFNRQNSDGAIVDLRKDGASIGTIQTNSGRLDIQGASNTVRIQSGTSLMQVTNGTQITFETAGTERMRIADNGKVGVGTTVPNRSDFNIHGANRTLASTTSQVAITASDSIAANIGGSLHFGARYDTTTTDFAPTGYVAGRRENATVNNYAGYLQFGVTQGNAGTIEAMRITSTGNVGIGRTDPTQLLEVHKNAGGDQTVAKFSAHNYGDTGKTFIEIGTEYGDGSSRIGSFNDTGNSSVLVFDTHSATSGQFTERMRITSTGNVGIGNSSPTNYGSTYNILHIGDANTKGLLKLGTGASVNGPELYSSANGKLHINTDSNTNVINLVNSNVAIGTTSPSHKLHIRGTPDTTFASGSVGVPTLLCIEGDNGFASGTAGSGIIFTGHFTSSGKTTLGQIGAIKENTTSGDFGGALVFMSRANGSGGGAAEQMRISSSGNVGINSSNPSTGRLVIPQSNSAQPAIHLPTDESTIQGPSANTQIRMGGNLVLSSAAITTLSTNGSERLRIASGNPYMFLGHTGHSWGTFHAVAQIGRTGAVANYDGGANQQTVIANNTYYGGSGYTSIEANSGASYMNLNQGHVSFFTAPATTAGSAQTFTKRVQIHRDGNVGIGEDTPAGPLHVTSTGSTSYFEGTGGNVSLQLLRSDTSGAVDFGDIQFANSTGIAARINSRGEGGSASGNLTFQTRNTSGTLTERMRIQSGGKVGIGGTVMDGQKLNIEGWVQSNTRTPANAWLVGRGTGGDGLAIGTSISSPYATWFQSGYLPTMGTSNHYALSFNPHGGNVGIATVNPTAKLHIVGGSSKVEHTNGGIVFVKTGGASSTNSDYMAAILRTDTAGYHVTADNGGFGSVADGLAIMNHGDLFFATAPTTGGGTNYPSGRVMIKSTGNVGIGTSAPEETLSVMGDFQVALNTSVTGRGLKVSTSNSSITDDLVTFNAQASTGILAFQTNSSERARIDASGNVGIGTTAPATGTHTSYQNLVIGETSSSTSGLSFKASTSGQSAIFFSDGVSPFNRGQVLYDHSTDSLTLASNGVEKLRLDGSGQTNVRLGGSTTNGTTLISSCTSTSSSGGAGTGNYLELEAMEPNNPNYGAKKLRLGVQGGGYVKMTMPGAAGLFIESPYQTADKIHVGYAGVQLDMNGGGYGGNQHMLIRCVNDITFHPGSSEKVRFDSSGNVGIGRSSPNAKLDINAGTTKGIEIALGTSTVPFINFLYGATTIGSITTTGSATVYNTSSDQRLKDNIVDAPSASDDIDAIQVRSFDWKADGSHQKYGMVAQELQSVAPEAVSGDADSDEMMGVDYSKLVPMLVKALQESRQEINNLKSRVEELESQ